MITALKPYAAMKDSGIGWLGKVPAGWDVRRLGDAVLDCVNGIWGADPNGVNDLPCVRVADFDRQRRRVRDPIPTIRAVAPNERRRRMLEAGDLLLEKSGGGEQQPVGVVILFDHKVRAVCSNFVARMPIRDGFDPRFLTFLHSSLYAIGLNTRSIKQTTGIQNLDSAAYLGEAVAFPPLSEQVAIVRYLDYVDRRVRRLVGAKRKLIALLTEQKQAIIHRAVTRGLDPDVPLKDSGVEWLGKVPAHWEVAPLCSVAKTKSITGQQDRELLSVYLDLGVIRFSDVKAKRTNATSEDLSKYQAVDPGDLVLNNQQAWRGSVGVSKHTGIVSPAYLVLSLSPQANEEFANLLFRDRTMVSRFLVASKGVGSIQRNLSWPHLKRVSVLLPPLCEQSAIVASLNQASDNIDAATSRASREIGLLEEYRTRLIADVVTGKLDVREAAAALPEVDPLDGEGGLEDGLGADTEGPDNLDAIHEEVEA